MKFFIDFDGTLINTIKIITSMYCEDFYDYKNFKPIHWTDVKTWEFKELNCTTPAYINTYFNQQRFFDKIEFMPNAKEVVKMLSNYGEVIIVSMGSAQNLMLKEKWIKKYLPFCKFIGVDLKEHEDKRHIDMSGDCTIFIDDSTQNLETSNAEIKICFGEKYHWNDTWEGIRCYTWAEIFRYVNKYIYEHRINIRKEGS